VDCFRNVRQQREDHDSFSEVERDWWQIYRRLIVLELNSAAVPKENGHSARSEMAVAE
jgi:hypothetical protein